jgi:phage terminase large subunit GpA-like protein
MLDATSDPTVWKVVYMTSAQVGKTEIVNNVVGYHIDQDPGPMLVVQPTVAFAETWSKDRLAPMLRDTPCLRGKIADPKSRDSGNTITHKSFPGGHLSAVGANSPTDLAGRPIRILLEDERDRYPASAGTEGDPGKLAEKRTNNFWNRKIIITSTPTIKGLSPIEREYEASDKRKFFIPCPNPECGQEHTLQWGNVLWEKGDPETARFRCPHCLETYSNGAKNRAVAKGRWIATAPFKGVAGFHLNELYSPWRTIQQIVADFLISKDSPELLQVFVNTVLGETWEEGGLSINEHDLEQRCENYPAEVPGRVLMLTAGVDTQPDRLEIEVVGWAGGEESWSIAAHVIPGDPDIKEGQPGSPWTDLTAYLRRAWKHELYGDMAVEWTCIDTGGENTQAVYAYVKTHKGDRFFGVKGQGGDGLPIVGTPQRKRTGKKARLPITLYMVGADQAKAVIYRRLRIADPGPGYCHFPKGRPIEWFRQITAEKIVTKYVKGFPRRTFEKPSGKRNEALDCRVYAFAALTIAAPEFDKIALRLKQRVQRLKITRPSASEPKDEPEQPEPVAEEETPAHENPPPSSHITRKPIRQPIRRGGFVNAWRQ